MARRDVLNNHPPHGYLCVALLIALLSAGCSPRGGEGTMEHEGSAAPPNAAPEASATPTAPISAGAATADSEGSGAASRPSPSALDASDFASCPAMFGSRPVPAECIVPLEELCSSKDRERECDLIRESVKDPSVLEKGPFSRTDFGTCGEYRYTSFGNGPVYLSFYDKRGRLKGVREDLKRTREYSSMLPRSCMGRRYFGEPIECSREPGKWYRSKKR